MKIIDGKELAKKLNIITKDRILDLGISPVLKIIFVGDNKASSVYVNMKQKLGAKLGIKIDVEKYPQIDDAKLRNRLKILSEDPNVHGIIVQLPAPGIEDSSAFENIAIEKDVDGLNPKSLGLLWQGDFDLDNLSSTNNHKIHIPATAKACMFAIAESLGTNLVGKEFRQAIEGKDILIINHSLIIGKPLAAVLINLDATVTVAHAKTKHLDNLIQNSEIIISGTGQHGLLNQHNIPEFSTIIDTGFSMTSTGAKGDVDHHGLEHMNIALSPVPGGIGPLGVSCLMANTLDAALQHI